MLSRIRILTNIEYGVELNDKDPKFKVGDHVSISKCKNNFAKSYTPNCPEEVFMVKKVKISVPWTDFINDFIGEEIVETFYEKELQKISKIEFNTEKIISRIEDKLYVKGKGCEKSFNSWINMKDIL